MISIGLQQKGLQLAVASRRPLHWNGACRRLELYVHASNEGRPPAKASDTAHAQSQGALPPPPSSGQSANAGVRPEDPKQAAKFAFLLVWLGCGVACYSFLQARESELIEVRREGLLHQVTAGGGENYCGSRSRVSSFC